MLSQRDIPTRLVFFCLTIAPLLVAPVAGPVSGPVFAGTISTILGTGQDELQPAGAPDSTPIGNPFGLEFGPDGALYVCEVSNHRVWRFDPVENRLTVVAGTGVAGYEGDGGAATEARLNEPYEIRFDSEGNLFFVEMRNHVIRRVDRGTGIISTVAGVGRPGFRGDGGPATQAQLNQPHSLAISSDQMLYIADIGNHRIRKVDLGTGIIESFAGSDEKRLPVAGQSVTGTPVLGPRALYLTPNTLWVALREGHSVWNIDLRAPVWRPVAGTGEQGYSGDGGPGLKATFNGPKGIAVDVARHRLFVVDTENQVIRVVDLKHGNIMTLAGVGPEARGFREENFDARAAWLNRPHGVCLDSAGNVYIGDSENHRVRRIEVTE